MPFKFKDKPKHLYAEDVRDYLRQIDQVFNMIEEEMKDEEQESIAQDQPQHDRLVVENPQNQNMIRNSVNLEPHVQPEVVEEIKSCEEEFPNNEQINSPPQNSENMRGSFRIRQNNVNLNRNIDIASHANSSSIEV